MSSHPPKEGPSTLLIEFKGTNYTLAVWGTLAHNIEAVHQKYLLSQTTLSLLSKVEYETNNAFIKAVTKHLLDDCHNNGFMKSHYITQLLPSFKTKEFNITHQNNKSLDIVVQCGRLYIPFSLNEIIRGENEKLTQLLEKMQKLNIPKVTGGIFRNTESVIEKSNKSAIDNNDYHPEITLICKRYTPENEADIIQLCLGEKYRQENESLRQILRHIDKAIPENIKND